VVGVDEVLEQGSEEIRLWRGCFGQSCDHFAGFWGLGGEKPAI
jgi:hypothetical protein